MSIAKFKMGDLVEVSNTDAPVLVGADHRVRCASAVSGSVGGEGVESHTVDELMPAASHVAALRSPARRAWQAARESDHTFERRVHPCMLKCSGSRSSSTPAERNHRFLEEVLELVQARGCRRSEAEQLLNYVYDQPVGESVQEVGGVMVTFAALCTAQGINMQTAGELDLARVWTKIDVSRAKQAAKPKHSPLPGTIPPQTEEATFSR